MGSALVLSSIAFGCTALFATLAIAQDNDRDPFTPLFQKALRESEYRFRSLRAERIENRRREYFHESKVYLPAATYCRVLDQPTLVFTCEWNRPGGAGSLTALYAQLVAKVERELGPEWGKRAAPPGKLPKQTLFTGSNRPTVGVIEGTEPAAVHLFITPAGASTAGVWEQLRSLDDFFHP